MSFRLSSPFLLDYWKGFSPEAIAVSAVASVAGALLVTAHRSVLTAGVMIALALVPASSLVVMGLVAWDLDVAGRALLRWLLEVGIVLTGSTAVFAWKRGRVHRRESAL